MHGRAERTDTQLEALLDERDYINVQLSMARDASPPNEHSIKELRLALSEVESKIRLMHYPRT
jgi:hypothetical protein